MYVKTGSCVRLSDVLRRTSGEKPVVPPVVPAAPNEPGWLSVSSSCAQLVKALDYLSEDELRALRASRSNCARMVAGLLRRLRDD